MCVPACILQEIYYLVYFLVNLAPLFSESGSAINCDR